MGKLLGTCGNYVLLERIGEGGMAEVFTARTTATLGVRRILAVKRLLPSLASNKRFVTMFIDEARIAVDLVHDNIVQIFELGVSQGDYYIAMEYVPGTDLSALLEDVARESKRFPVAHAAYIAGSVGAALEYAHGRTDAKGDNFGIVHRDISPQNVLISFEGAVKVADFGIALAKHRIHHTVGARLKGKIVYMSPEQAWGSEVDWRSDIFSLGTVLYRMLTGRLPFDAPKEFDALEKVRKVEMKRPRELCPDIPEGLEDIVLRAMAREREDRYQSAGELLDELEPYRVVDGRPLGARDLAAAVKQLSEVEAERRRDTLASLSEEAKKAEPEDQVPEDWTGVATERLNFQELSESVVLAVHRPWVDDGRRTIKVDPAVLPDAKDMAQIAVAAIKKQRITDPHIKIDSAQLEQTTDEEVESPWSEGERRSAPVQQSSTRLLVTAGIVSAIAIVCLVLLLCR
jgi:serine/threonine protein kinase